MVRTITPGHQKLAERLVILNDRGQGMLTRIYNIKKACSDSKSKPSFLSDKTLESAIKHVIRKFPSTDTKSNVSWSMFMNLETHDKWQSTLTVVFNIKHDIIKSLSLYYYTFVDLLDFKDHVSELFTTMDACQLQLDITVNHDLTKGYLDLMVTYVSLLLLLARVEDRKAVLGLFNVAHEMTHGHGDGSFPRLGQMIIEYENPIKKLSEEFVPHSKLLVQSLMSLHKIFTMRNLPADEWRKSQILSLVASPSQMLNPAQTDVIQCEYLSLDAMERYLIFGFLLVNQALQQPAAQDLFQKALHCGWVTTLFRDEVIQTHSFVQQFFESFKGATKRVNDVKEAHTWILSNASHIHRERRKFLRSALKELGLIFSDQPGLLGPKSLLVLMALSFARDEVHWLLRHYDNPPVRQRGIKNHPEDLVDRQLPELLFHIEELRSLVHKYNQVIQRYYVQYLQGYDAVALNQIMQNISMMPEDDAVIVESAHAIISNLSVKQVENNDPFDLRGLRLDWFRLQAYSSVGRYPMHLFEHRDLAVLMNMVVFHTKMVDNLDELILETSDLSIFCFYSKIFDEQFHMCLEFPAQTRYIISFPLICGHFMNCNHELCPEERHHIGDRSLTMVNGFLDEMAKEARNIITTICDRQFILSDQLLPKHVAPQIAQVVNKKKRDKKTKVIAEGDKPGAESYRRSREELTTMDKLHMALTELCFAINHSSAIQVWEHTFAPREYLAQHLETRFNKALVGMVMYCSETQDIAKPSELLHSVKAYMNVLQTIENYVNIDITRVFNNVLLQQTQPQDSHGEKTITSLYTNWYLEVLLRKVSAGQICYSSVQRAFVSLTVESQVPFCAEEFSDGNELRALTELIGPYGMRYLSESLMWHIASQVTELKKLVILNKDTLIALRSNYDKPDAMKELFRRLQNVDNVLQRMSIVGVILCFRGLCQEALNEVLAERIPFLLSSVVDFKHNMPNTEHIIVSEMAAATGLPCRVDPALVMALKAQKSDLGDEEYQIACLLMVFVAVSLPKLARGEGSFYKPSLESHANNINCIAQAINGIACALFTICGRGDIEARLKEFLALASSSLLRLGQEQDKEAIKNRESVYILLDMIVKESPFLTMDLLESCFPYSLLRNAYHAVFKTDSSSQPVPAST